MLKWDNVIPPTEPELAGAALLLLPLNERKPEPGPPAVVPDRKDDAHFTTRITPSPGPAPGRTALRDMLRRAVENTAKMPKGGG